MKIALISPRGRFLSNDPEFISFWENTSESMGYRYFWSGASTGLLTIAGLSPKGFKIKFIDENFEDINFDEDFDLVALSAMTQQADRAYEIADGFKKKGVKVVIGGIHASLLPDEAKEHVDSVFIGEGEDIWPEFLKDFTHNNIRPIYKSSCLTDLKKSPLPRFDLLNPKNHKMVWIQTTRGCPIDCEFCAASKIFGLKFRRKNIKQVVEEVKAVKKIWNPARINFADDNMFMDKKYGEELVRALIPLRIRWTVQTDISIANDDNLLALARKAGCEIMFIGLESIAENNLKGIDRGGWKHRCMFSYSSAIQKIQSYGIGIMGAFIIGFDGDDENSITRLINFIIENNLFGVQVTILTPFPGTRLRDNMLKDKKVLPNRWSNYTGFDVNFTPSKISPIKLQKGLLKIYRAIYSQDVRIRKLKYFKHIYSNLDKKIKSKKA